MTPPVGAGWKRDTRLFEATSKTIRMCHQLIGGVSLRLLFVIFKFIPFYFKFCSFYKNKKSIFLLNAIFESI